MGSPCYTSMICADLLVVGLDRLRSRYQDSVRSTSPPRSPTLKVYDLVREACRSFNYRNSRVPRGYVGWQAGRLAGWEVERQCIVCVCVIAYVEALNVGKGGKAHDYHRKPTHESCFEEQSYFSHLIVTPTHSLSTYSRRTNHTPFIPDIARWKLELNFKGGLGWIGMDWIGLDHCSLKG